MWAGFVSKSQPSVSERKPVSFPIILKLCILEIGETLIPADRNSQQPLSSPSSEHGYRDCGDIIAATWIMDLGDAHLRRALSKSPVTTTEHITVRADSDHNICLVNSVLSVVRE
nr:hypothetical protein Iba_chr06aCG16880 [Ipomoea batatas]